MTYVMSDIHGNAVRFNDVMAQVDLQPEDTLYILGDAIDRYPDGIKIIRWAMKQQNVHMLLGNHEYMMLRALYYPIDVGDEHCREEWIREDRLNLWYNNGGDITHDYLKHIRKDIRKEVFEYLAALPLNIKVEVNGQKFLLIHGGVEDNFERYSWKYDNKTQFAVWSRNSHHEIIPDDTVLIFGHTPTNHYQRGKPLRVWECGNYFGIDCGAGYGSEGRLCCLRLEDLKEFYSKE